MHPDDLDPIRQRADARASRTEAEWRALELSEDELRRIEARWKSDVDLKLDALISAEGERGRKYDAFIEILIQREQARAALRKAVIEKTLSGLVWMAVVALLSLAWSGAKQELFGFVGSIRGGK